MKGILTLLMFLLFWQSGGNRITRIAETNRLKGLAAEAYAAGDYAAAADIYEVLLLQWGITTDAVRLNHAHALFRAEKIEAAAEAYRLISEGETGPVAKSIALQQLGYLASQNQKLPDALQYFKEALKANPENEIARRNYELAWQQLNKTKKDPEQEEEQKQDKEEQPPLEPSAWAAQQKARADALYRQFRYAEALQLMQESLQKDSTVAAYNDYIQRLGDITEIDQ